MYKNFRRVETESALWLEELRTEAVEHGMKCVVNGVAFNGNKALILKRAPWKDFLPNCWDLPGGHVKSREPLLIALRREVREELGVDVKQVFMLLATWSWERVTNGRVEHVRQFEFCVSLSQNNQLQVSSEDFVDHRWILESELDVLQEARVPTDTHMKTVLQYAFEAKRTFSL